VIRYHWDFGNGDTSNVPNPKYVYQNHGKFTVQLTVFDRFGCKKDTSLTLDILKGLGYESYLSESVSIYPNPVNDYLIIRSSVNQRLNLELLDSRGRQIIMKDFLHNDKLDVSILASGVYLIRISDGNGRLLVREIIKND
jgi:hypothetical protein